MVADVGDQITKVFQEAFGYSSSEESWAHEHRNCQDYANKFIKDDKAKGEVLKDIDLLQVMPPPEAFDLFSLFFFFKIFTHDLNRVCGYLIGYDTHIFRVFRYGCGYQHPNPKKK